MSNGKSNFATLENVINNPGLLHIAEGIFSELDNNSLEVCQNINQASKQILANLGEKPSFWLGKFIRGGLSKKNQEDWTKAIRSVKNSEMKKHIVLYLKWTLKNKGAIDLPCYTNPGVQDDFEKQILKNCSYCQIKQRP